MKTAWKLHVNDMETPSKLHQLAYMLSIYVRANATFFVSFPKTTINILFLSEFIQEKRAISFKHGFCKAFVVNFMIIDVGSMEF